LTPAGRVELVTVSGLDRRVTIVRAGDEVDAIFVLTEKFGVLLDTLATPELCAEALGLLRPLLDGRRLLVVNTHMDWDHFWGNAALPAGTTIFAHAGALTRLRDGSAAALLADKQADPRYAHVRLVEPTITFDSTLVLDGGDLHIELFHTPGHTPDHLAAWIPELQLCLAADAVESPVPEVWSEAPSDLANLVASLRRIADLRPAMLLPAHGQTTSPDVVANNRAYFDALARRVAALRPEILRATEPTRLPGLSLESFALLAPMPEATLDFYRACHARNFAATVRTRLETEVSAQSIPGAPRPFIR